MRPTTRSHHLVYDENSSLINPAKKVKTTGLNTTSLVNKPTGVATRHALGDISNREQTNVPQGVKKPTLAAAVSVPAPAAPVVAAPRITHTQFPGTALHLPYQTTVAAIPARIERMSISASKPKHQFTIDADDMEMKDEEMAADLEEGVNVLSISSIDAADSRNAQAVSEYVHDIMSHFRRTETRFLASSTYMSRQTDISIKMREILIDWLIEVHLKFKLQQETLYLTINLIDRFLERRHVGRTKLQLVGCTAMLIASKYEEIFPPEVRDFVFISDNAYTKEQIIQMECVMLKTLEFNITVPSALRFAERLIKLSGNVGDETYRHLVSYLMEMTLQEYKFLSYKPSIVAASAVVLAQSVLQQQAWPALLSHESGYTCADLTPCVDDLLALYNQEAPKYRAVRKKYTAKKYAEVAKSKVGPARPW